MKRTQSNILHVSETKYFYAKTFPHRRPPDNHIAIDQDLRRRSTPVDILASYQNHLTPEPEDVEGIRGPQIGMHNTDSGYRDWGVRDLGEYFLASLDRAFCPHEIKSLSGKIWWSLYNSCEYSNRISLVACGEIRLLVRCHAICVDVLK